MKLFSILYLHREESRGVAYKIALCGNKLDFIKTFEI